MLALAATVTVRAEDNAAQSAARAALMQKLQAENTNAPAASSATASQPVGDNAAQAKARAAIMQQMAHEEKSTAPAAAPATKPVAPTPIMTAPAMPIPMTKEQKLQQLNAKYKADQISPKEYHEQRAAILSEP
jgi:hypothetical protein